MPTKDSEANVKYSSSSQARARRAYNYLKAWAIREGWMRHKLDTAGFDKFMDNLEGKRP